MGNKLSHIPISYRARTFSVKHQKRRERAIWFSVVCAKKKENMLQRNKGLEPKIHLKQEWERKCKPIHD